MASAASSGLALRAFGATKRSTQGRSAPGTEFLALFIPFPSSPRRSLAWHRLRSLRRAATSVQKSLKKPQNASKAMCVEVYWSGMAQLYRDARLCALICRGFKHRGRVRASFCPRRMPSASFGRCSRWSPSPFRCKAPLGTERNPKSNGHEMI